MSRTSLVYNCFRYTMEEEWYISKNMVASLVLGGCLLDVKYIELSTTRSPTDGMLAVYVHNCEGLETLEELTVHGRV